MELTDRLLASPTSAIVTEDAEHIKSLQAQASYEADIAEAALEEARELSAEKAELERIVGQQAAAIRELQVERDAFTDEGIPFVYAKAKADEPTRRGMIAWTQSYGN